MRQHKHTISAAILYPWALRHIYISILLKQTIIFFCSIWKLKLIFWLQWYQRVNVCIPFPKKCCRHIPPHQTQHFTFVLIWIPAADSILYSLVFASLSCDWNIKNRCSHFRYSNESNQINYTWFQFTIVESAKFNPNIWLVPACMHKKLK